MSSEVKINTLKTDTKNFNQGSKKGAELIKTSFFKFGAGRSILIDKNNNIRTGKILKGYRPLEPSEIVMIIKELNSMEPSKSKELPSTTWSKFKNM